MSSEKEKVCCFTGHRTISAGDAEVLPELLYETLCRLYADGVREFRTGGAVGFDTLAALSAIRLKNMHSDVKLRLMLPCRDQCSKWRPSNIKSYKEILAAADSVEYVSLFYNENCMHLRNLQLVRGSDYCVCYKRKGVGGGAAFTVRKAEEENLEIINLLDLIEGRRQNITV